MVIGIFSMTIRLYLMRHATAEPHGGPGRDAQRPLTEAGRTEARGAARGLKRLKVEPEQLITSPYLRARQTAEAVAALLAPAAALKELGSLRPESDPQATSSDLKAFKAAKSLMFFGHEPHMSAWVAWLVGGDAGMRCLMKKASVACIEVEHLPPAKGGGLLRWLMTPKQMALIGEEQ